LSDPSRRQINPLSRKLALGFNAHEMQNVCESREAVDE
jgi:hypothetical protein